MIKDQTLKMDGAKKNSSSRWTLITLSILSLLLLAVLSSSLYAPAQDVSDALRIISPADGSVVAPGETITVELSIESGLFFDAVQVIGEDIGISEPRSAPPFQFSLTIPNNIIGPRKLTALGIIGSEDGVFSRPVIIDIETDQGLATLSVSPSQIDFQFSGEQMPLSVTGEFADGTGLLITQSTRTNYSSTDTAIAMVDAAGLVTAVGAGMSNIVVRYDNQSVSVPISVPQTIPGDLDGDGDVDQDDLNIILDGLGQAAVGSFDARDLNRDGMINFQDAEQIELVCTRECATINIPPDVSQARPSITSLWPPNHKMVLASVLGVTDSDGDPVTIRIELIRQNEPTNGLGDADTCPDGQGVGTSSAQLRAERSGTGTGRLYTIFFTAEDSRGGTSLGTVKVCVPHDEGDGCEEDGAMSDSILCPSNIS